MRPWLRRPRRLLQAVQTAWSILGATLVLIVVLELLLRGGFRLKDRGRPQVPPDPRVLAAVEGAAEWLPLHYRELERLSDRWSPYVYFRQRLFRGRTITIDAEGLRASWRPPEEAGADGADRPRPPVKLLLLGGSSLWGFGARDEETIPSHLARRLHERGVRAEVRNLAEIGYVSTQEVVALVRELQRGYRPDLVLFYDGVNDTTSALLEGRATLTTNEVNRVREFNILQSPARLSGAFIDRLVKDSASYRLASALGRRLGADPAGRRPAVSDEAALGRLADEVVQGYLANKGLAEALGKTYGFRALFAWQPVIFSKPRLVPFEEEERRKFGWSAALFERVRERLRGVPGLADDLAFLDLSGLFDDADGLVFLDFCHTTEQANARIASALASRLFESGMIQVPAGRSAR